jgi:hypothetical protein
MTSIETWNRSVLRRNVLPQIEEDLVHIAPGPALRRIVSLNDGVMGGMVMVRRMVIRRLIAATHVTAGSANPEMNPDCAHFQAFLAAACARCDAYNGREMPAIFAHGYSTLSSPLVVATIPFEVISARENMCKEILI